MDDAKIDQMPNMLRWSGIEGYCHKINLPIMTTPVMHISIGQMGSDQHIAPVADLIEKTYNCISGSNRSKLVVELKTMEEIAEQKQLNEAVALLRCVNSLIKNLTNEQ